MLPQVRISRKRIMESAMKVFDMYGSSRAVLEIEYFNEVGTGLGPTLEFYTMLSHDFQRRGLKLWRGDEEKLSSTATGAFHVTAGQYCSAKLHICDETGKCSHPCWRHWLATPCYNSADLHSTAIPALCWGA